ncbi:class I SAM-dependent methyltransferase [Sporomusa sp.]|uniref:class I SAM-dependent methyltransferase n=1 Tax=Sporomusa sp. TaxID=2078658 RepID=UPI002C38B918|nr:class I SAM-dependent methyltransferase [Sporomusa sp.]HWR08602.1 class I SAM-dependent methyltransferase [Sporomusa sp.]
MGRTQDNLFRCTAGLYDLDERSVTKDDIDFYRKQAAGLAGGILELACGTGRVSIPLAVAGNEVWGIDLSKEMLAEMTAKIQELPAAVQNRLHVFHADMTKFALEKTFSLIIIPFRGFQALISNEQQGACLAAVYRHLADDGRFIIDVFRPYARLDEAWVQPETLDWELVDPKTGNTVRRTSIRRKIDVEEQIIYPELVYDVHEQGTIRRLVEPLALKYYYEDQIRNLLTAYGFTIEDEMGYYDGRPISEGPELIFICKK